MKKANVRVEVKNYNYSNGHTSEKQFRILMSEFRKACHSSGIIKEMKKREFYESPSEKKRRVKKEYVLNLFKQKMKESFVSTGANSAKTNKSKNGKSINAPR
jgi:ribosomal protein S21